MKSKFNLALVRDGTCTQPRNLHRGIVLIPQSGGTLQGLGYTKVRKHQSGGGTLYVNQL